MDRDIACCVGVDLASAILVTLQELPPGTDYIVRRWPVDPRTGRVIATRVRDVDVNASRIANGQPFGGSPFGSIMIDVTLDADVARVTANGVASGRPSTDIHVITTMSLVWRGTMYDPETVPAPNPPAALALENFRLRGQPRIAWGGVGASASINGLPDWLGPGHVVPPVVPALTWPDECAIGSWQTEVYNAPDDIKLDLANLFSAALIKLVAGIIDGPRLMANALGPAGAKAVTLDLQGRQLYITAIGWSPVDGAVDPVTATRQVWRNLGIGWADDTPWTAPYKLWISPDLLLRATRLTVGKDAVREEAAEGVTADMLRLWPAPYTAATPMPWLRWFRETALAGQDPPPNPNGTAGSWAPWARANFLALTPDQQRRAMVDLLSDARAGIWPLRGEAPVPGWLDPDVEVGEPSVSFRSWVEDGEAGALCPFLPNQDLGIRVRTTYNVPWYGISGNIEVKSYAAIGPFLEPYVRVTTDADIGTDFMFEVVRIGALASFLIGSVVLGAAGVGATGTVAAGSLVEGFGRAMIASSYGTVDDAEELLAWTIDRARLFAAVGLGTATFWAIGAVGQSIPFQLWLASFFGTNWAENWGEGKLEQRVEGEVPEELRDGGLIGMIADLKADSASVPKYADLYEDVLKFAGATMASPIGAPRLVVRQAASNGEFGLEMAFGMDTNGPNVDASAGLADTVATGAGVVEPLRVEVGEDAHLVAAVSADRSRGGFTRLRVDLEVLPGENEPGALFYVIPPDLALIGQVPLDISAADLNTWRDAGELEDFDARFPDGIDNRFRGEVLWAVHIGALDRWLLGVTRPADEIDGDTADNRKAVESAAGDRAFAGQVMAKVRAGWNSSWAFLSIGQLTGMAAGTPELALGAALTTLHLRLSERVPSVGLAAFQAAVDGLLLTQVQAGTSSVVLSRSLGVVIDETADDELAARAMRLALAQFLYAKGVAAFQAFSPADTVALGVAQTAAEARAVARLVDATGGDATLRAPAHLVRAVRPLRPGGVRLAALTLSRDPEAAVEHAAPGRHPLHVEWVTDYPRWTIRLRIAYTSLLDVPANIRVDLVRPAIGGQPEAVIWNANPAATDLAYTGLPPAVSGVAQELVSGLVSASFTLTDAQLGPGDRDLLVLWLRVSIPGLDRLDERVVLRVRDRRYVLTAKGRTVRDTVAELGGWRDFQHAFAELPAFDGSRPDVDPLLDEVMGQPVSVDPADRVRSFAVGPQVLAKWRARFRPRVPMPPPPPAARVVTRWRRGTRGMGG